MFSIIAIQICGQEDRTVQVFNPALPPIHLIHDQIHQDFARARQGKPRDATLPDADVDEIPDQFRIVTPTQGGGDEWDSNRVLDGTSDTPLAIDASGSIALSAYPSQRGYPSPPE
jgi:hypothetical protein